MLKEVEVHQVVGNVQTNLKKNLRRREKIEEKSKRDDKRKVQRELEERRRRLVILQRRFHRSTQTPNVFFVSRDLRE